MSEQLETIVSNTGARLVALSENRSAWRAALTRLRMSMVLLTVMCCGCSVPSVTDTVPLPQAKLLPPGSESISQGGYRAEALAGTGDLMVLVAMSGGGKRSAAYAYGALKGMREVRVPTASGRRSLL